jgi:lysosomal Pro-X carboxypeptidase
VDHFGYANSDRFNQRVIISHDNWCEGCPIFFYAGNEGDIFMFANNTGFIWENAAKFRALVVFPEHRYYGQSLPYGDKAFESLETVGFLTTEQAMADFAENIQDLRRLYPGAKSSPVIMFGGSYGGMLASWFRMKYPHLVEGALAASAPILQFPELYDCSGYFKIVTKDFENYSKSCSDSIRNSWPAVKRLGASEEGRKWLKSNFRLCQDLEEEDIESFMAWISSLYEDLAMTDYPNAASFLQPMPAYPIKELCKKLTSPDKEDKPLLEDIYQGLSVYLNYTGTASCNNVHEDSQLGLNGWDFQSCTEMVMPICADGVSDMFWDRPWNLSLVAEECYQKWKVRPQPLKAQTMFGGKNITAASNIIFSNGDRDPWSAGGVLDTVSSSVISLKIPGACHHEDLRPVGPNDPQSLLDVRRKELDIIQNWIHDYYQRIGFFPPDLKWIELQSNNILV